MTTTPAGLSLSAADVYREKMFKILGDQNPLEVMAQTASKLAAIAERYPANVLRTRPFAGKWTPNEVVGHLTDTEWVYGYRLRLILSEDDPTILSTQQDAWVAHLRHNERDPHELVEVFRTLRELNLAAWNRTSAHDLKRAGHHNERGPESLDAMLRLLAGHDLNHLDQINRYIQAVHNTPAR
jgi:DinB superfamily